MLSDNALRVLEKRYFTRDEHGNTTEDAEGLFRRVAKAIAEIDKEFDPADTIEETAEKFYRRMTSLEFLPNSPTLMNAGKPLGQLSACFVLPISDSLEGIFETIKNAALIHQSGGGTGFSFSRLRPEGSAVRSSGGVASGPVSFMKVYNAATEAIKQGGTRRGANMGILRVDHPDIREFITCKADLTQFTNFNISVGLTEAFMAAVENDEPYELIDPSTGEAVRTERARDIFDLIVDMAWQNGEPGIVFLDRLNRDNVTPDIGIIESTNPCGEQPLLPYESCNLGSINLGRMLREDGAGGFAIDYDLLGEVVDDAVHFLDNVISANKYPLEQIREMSLGTRKIGLGVMGWADMLYKLGVPYNSEEGVSLAEDVMGYINMRAKEASRILAEMRGPFPYVDRSLYREDPYPPRNATVTTIAPTGTISIIASCSSGVEPLFALSFVRNVMDHDALPEVHPYFEEVARARGFYSPELIRAVAERGTLERMEGIPEDVRRVFVTAHDVSPEYHIRMQAAFQQSTDNAVSKTVNFSHSATREDVREVYELAWRLGCKGVTIYRDGSRSEQVLSIGNKASDKQAAMPHGAVQPRPRPAVTMGITEKVRIGCGNLYVTVNYDEEGICEVFTNLGRAGGCPSQSEATSRLVSMALRAGMDVRTVIEQLRGIRCHSTLRQPGLKVLSCPDAIGRVLEKVVSAREGQAVPLIDAEALKPDREQVKKKNGCISNCSLCAERAICAKGSESLCPECGALVEFEGGCMMCRACGYSKCG
ncbi:MAG: vitamin B12-dependent ribonucleotide reductase [Firmicutes bacterium]|nr:vitamin B12-dependent ribonucleotide reductase [Bacillota bacterium]